MVVRQRKMDLVNLSHFGGYSKISTVFSFNKILSLLIKTSKGVKKYHAGNSLPGIKNASAFRKTFITNI